jgi:hypothetical protein
MNNRLDQLPAKRLMTEIDRLEQDLGDLKTRQSIPRSLVTRAYPFQTTNAFDVSDFAIAANTAHYFYIEYDGDGTQASPYAQNYCQVYNNGTDAAHRLSDYQLNDSTGTSYSYYLQYPSPLKPVDSITIVLSVLAGASGASIYIKLRLMGTSKATNVSVNL